VGPNGKNRRFIDWGAREGLIGIKCGASRSGIEQANYDILAFTDADCLVRKLVAANSQGFGHQTDYVWLILDENVFRSDTKFRLKNCTGSYYGWQRLGCISESINSRRAIWLPQTVFLRAGGV
jgi:hypothetical protein